MRTFNKKSIVGALALVMTLALAASMAILPRAQTAEAARGSMWVDVGDIMISGGGTNGEKLHTLYSYLTEEGTFSSVQEAAKEGRNSADFREVSTHKNRNITLTFGGFKWDVVYLTTASNGDVVLDLWRSADTLTMDRYEKEADGYTTSDYKDIWHYSNNWNSSDTDMKYPSNMYSTSLVRVKALSAGDAYASMNGYYSNDGGEDVTEFKWANSTNQYSQLSFSSGGLSSNAQRYIVQPKNVPYQATEYHRDVDTTNTTRYRVPNDAYGEPSDGKWYSSSSRNMDYTSKGDSSKNQTLYDAWKGDYLWLPSVTEVGGSAPYGTVNFNGLWGTDEALRSSPTSGPSSTLLRSGNMENGGSVYSLDSRGKVSEGHTAGDSSPNAPTGYVRPAIHFNLSAAARWSQYPSRDDWKDESKPYDPVIGGAEWHLEVGTAMGMSVTPIAKDGDTSWFKTNSSNGYSYTIKATEPGDYQVKVKPGYYGWAGGPKQYPYDTEEITVTYTLTKGDLEAKYYKSNDYTHPNRLRQLRETVFRSDGTHALDLKMPDESDDEYPIYYKGTDIKATGLDIKYIIKTHKESEHGKDGEPDDQLEGLKTSSDWNDFDDLDEKLKKTTDTLGYTVFYKATDPTGHNEDFYGWYGVHVAHEELTIKLKSDFGGLVEDIEYGDVGLKESTLETGLETAIDKVTSLENGSEVNKTSEFERKFKNFNFYLRTEDNGYGELYSIQDDGVHLGYDMDTVINLPVGTYYLYVAFVEAGAKSEHIVFKWDGGRSHFNVTARKITVALTFNATTYGDDPATKGWVSAVASRTGGEEGKWYAPNDATQDDDLGILNLSYKLNTGRTPDSRTHAGSYTVTPAWDNENYAVTFSYPSGQQYTVNKADIEAKYHDDDHLALLDQLREVAFRSDGSHKLDLKMPDESDASYPLFRSKSDIKATGLHITYIVKTHEEKNHTDDQDEQLDELKKSGEWKEFGELDENLQKTADTLGYCVFYKATDPSGDYNDFYGWYGVHVATEDLHIKLKTDGGGLLSHMEYGDVGLTETTLEEGLKQAIETITSQENGGVDKTAEFENNFANFNFYLRTRPDGSGTLYSIQADGVHLGRDTRTPIKLPVGTYYLYVAYVDAGETGKSSHILFTWEGDRPSFDVTARQITVPLTFNDKTYGDSDFSDWVSVGAPTRTGGKPGNWYADGENDIDEALKITYKLNGTIDSPDGTTPAGTYTVVATCGNRNYNVTFVGELTFNIQKRALDAPTIASKVYNGEEQKADISDTALYRVTENNGGIDAGDYSVKLALVDNGNYKWADSVTSELTLTFTILRANMQAGPVDGEGGTGDSEVIVDSEDGFEAGLEIVVERVGSVTRKYLAWETDIISEEYAVKMYKNGEEVPFTGKVTVRLLIPEKFRGRNFELMAVANETSIQYTRDGDYVVFEADGLSTYAFVSKGAAYFPVLFAAGAVILFSLGTVIVLAIMKKKN